jgi:hypothetical protein
MTIGSRPSRPRREVCFVKYYEKGSTDIAADQMAVALRRQGLAARAIPARELASVRDSVLVFIKRADLAHLLAARLRGNALVMDVHDTIVFRRGVRWSALYDGMIFRSAKACADFGGGRPGSVVIPHHWDERYAPHQAGEAAMKIAFIGDPRSWPFADADLPSVARVFTDWFARARDFNTHLSIRRPGREWLYKPNLKVATAAACNAVLLTTPDDTAVEQLGVDYPFYVGPTCEDVATGLRRAESLIGSAPWRQARALLDAIRARTTLARVTEMYVDYLQRFGALGELAAMPDAAAAPV